MKKLIVFLILCLLTTSLYAADTKLSALGENTTIAGGDLLYLVDIGTTTSQKITATNLFDMIDTFAELQAITADKTLINEEDAWTFDSIITFSDAITLSDAATIDQSANNYIDFAENADTLRFYYDSSNLAILWSDGALNLQNAEDVDAIVNIMGKDAGEKGILRILSDGDDKYIELYNDDTDAVITNSAGNIIINPVGLGIVVGDNGDEDYTITFDGDTSDGVLNYDEDNADFEFDQDVSTGGTFTATTSVITPLLDAAGAEDMDYGSADVTDHTFVTDGTGTAEIVLPTGSIDSTEILDDTVALADMAHADHGDVTWASGAALLDTDSVADNEIDYTAVTGADLTLTDCGAITSTGTITATVGFDIVGAADMDYGSVDVTDHTFVTDGTGDTEIVLPNDSIGNDELDWGSMTDLTTDGAVVWGNIAEGELANSTVIDADIKDDTIQEPALNTTNAAGAGTDNYVLTYNHAGTNFTWAVDADSGATAWDDIGNPDNNGLTTITFDNAETTLLTGDNDAAASFVTIQNTDGDHTVGQLYLLDLDYSADDGDAEADFIKCQDSGSIVFSVQQNGETAMDGGITSGGTIEGATLTESGVSVSNDNEIEAVVEPLIDTLANLTSVQGLTIGLADAGADAIWGWDDDAATYENLTAGEALTIIGGAANDFDGSGDVTIAASDISDLNGATDITADLEEETHASEHAVSGADTVFPADPDADRVLMWDDVPGALVWTAAGTGDFLADGTVAMTGNIELVQAATIGQSANNYITFTENSDVFEMYFTGTNVAMEWSDGSLILRNKEDGIDAYVGIMGKDDGEKGILLIYSDGDDKWLSLYHDDTDGQISSSAGDLYLTAVGGDINLGDDNLTTTGTLEAATITEGGVAVINATQGGAWTGNHDFGGADLEIPQASPGVPDADGEIEADFTDGTVVMQHGSAHAELSASTDVVVGKLIRSFAATIYEPDNVNDVIPIKMIDDLEFPHGVVIVECLLQVGTDSNYTLTLQNYDDFDTINAVDGTIDAISYTAGNDGEVTDTTITYGTIAAGQIIMMSIPSTDVDWIHIEIFYYEPAA